MKQGANHSFRAKHDAEETFRTAQNRMMYYSREAKRLCTDMADVQRRALAISNARALTAQLNDAMHEEVRQRDEQTRENFRRAGEARSQIDT